MLRLKTEKSAYAPYEYIDRQCELVISMDNFIKLVTGKLDPVAAFTLGKLKVNGDLGKAIEFSNIIKAEENAPAFAGIFINQNLTLSVSLRVSISADMKVLVGKCIDIFAYIYCSVKVILTNCHALSSPIRLNLPSLYEKNIYFDTFSVLI